MADISINDITTSNETGTATFTVTLSEAVGSDVTVDFTTSSQTLNFTEADIATSANRPYDVHVADIDGDGDLDIVSASYADDTIAWYENDGAADPSWTAVDIATSADGAYGVHVADMDGDGDLDIVSASIKDNTIAWYENDGAADPSWTAVDIATNAVWARDVHVADMDGDGDLDIVSASYADDTIAWYENDGAANPSWTAVDIATSADGAHDVEVADMDGDGDLDIVSASYEDDTIAWYENDGAADPSWTAVDIATNADSVRDVYVADMDGDGDLDIVSASVNDDTIAWHENDGAADPSWTSVDITTTADGAFDVHVADMDGDGDLDIVSAYIYEHTINWHENDGAVNPSWSNAVVDLNYPYQPTDVFVADMDGDGDLDIVRANGIEAIAWYENDGNLNTSAQAGVDYTANSGTLTIAAGSTTGTITIDLLQDSEEENTETATLTLSNPTNATISDSTGTLTITDDDSGSFTFISADITTSVTSAMDVHVADMDGDGDLDIISASLDDSSRFYWHENDGAADPSWTTTTLAIVGLYAGAHAAHVADMDGDGDLDIVSASFGDDTIAWHENDGAADPSWNTIDITTSADAARDVHVADMDGDGDLDIVSASSGDNTIAWYENDGAADPSWSAADIANSVDGAMDVHVADMDGDGDLDIVSASMDDNTIAWYENDGAADPSWSAADITTSAGFARDVHVADMDGDGDLDIVSASFSDDTIAWYENDGAADPSWSAADITTSADGASAVHVGDMDGDGDLDIVSASYLDDTIAWYENDGAADPTWTAADIDTSANYAQDVHVADMDGDGDLDIVSASSGDNTIAWYENIGSQPILNTSSPADDLTSVATNSNIVLNFTEAVDAESGNIVIYNASNDSAVETIDVTSGQVTGSGSAQITINPSSDLADSTSYYVQIAATAFDDSSSNSYAGINDKTTFNFTTADETAPTFSSAATNTAGTKVILTYNEALSATTAATSAFAVTTGGTSNSVTNVAISGSTIELTLTTTVKNDETVTVAYTDPSSSNDSNAIQDSSGNDAISLSSTSVTNNSTVAGTPPTLLSSSPVDDANSLLTTSNIVLTFSEAVDLKTGNIVIYNSLDNTVFETFDVSSSSLISGTGTNTITINPTSDLAEQTSYYIQIAETVFDDLYGNSYAGINDKTTFNFTTADETAPTLSPTGTTSISENTTTVHTFTTNETITWSLVGGDDSNLFTINSSSGALSFSSAPDYELSSDKDSNNNYVVIVRATDSSGNNSDQTLTVSLNDCPELDVSGHQIGTSYHLEFIRDYDGNLHANSDSVSDELKNSYKYQGKLDINNDSVLDAIYTNKISGRWVTGKINASTGEIDFCDYGAGGGTRVVGIYDDPLIAVGQANYGFLADGVTPAPAQFGATGSDRYVDLNGDGDFNDDNEDRLALNSQVRFQNDLLNDNLAIKHAGDYDGDGFQEVYWKTNDGDIYLRSLMHSDGNIQYANYQDQTQMSEYLKAQGHENVINDII